MSDLFALDDDVCETVEPEKNEPAYLSSLNPEQYQAVTTTQGPLLVLSGAGTGKTRVLTTRLAYIIDKKLAAPWQCFAVTFTNKAAKEMSERLEKMIGSDYASIWLGTFHRLGLRILRQHFSVLGFNKDFVILGDDDQERLLKIMMQENGVDIKQWTPAALNAVIQRWKDRGLSPESVTAQEDSGFLNGRALGFYKMYQKRLKELNAVDFGDLLLLPLEIFKLRPDILSYYQQQFRYILVDEYQDTNVAQYLLLRLLAMGHNNLCCVGDDDQSIYSWRGAEVENILRFEKDFPDAQIIRLESNYRSTTHILGTASALISHNEGRLGKTLHVAPGLSGDGEKVQVHGYWNGFEEAAHVVDEIENEMRSTPLNQIAILVRAGHQTRSFEEALFKAGISYQVIGDYKFYDREEIRDAIAYLRLILNPTDDLAFRRIVNKPKRGVGDTSIQHLSIYARDHQMSLMDSIDWADLKNTARTTLLRFRDNIMKWRKQKNELKLSELTNLILEESGYYAMWRMDKSVEAPGRLDNLKELINEMHGEYDNLEHFIEHVTLVTNSDKDVSDNKMTIMTLHASKGLEFNTVFLPGWEEGLFPHSRCLEESGSAGLEEERRLAYVGLTRARKKAFISFASNRKVYGGWQNALPSRFIDELPAEHISKKSDSGLMGGYESPASSSWKPNPWSTKPSWQTYTEDTDEDRNSHFYEWGKSSSSFDDYSYKKKIGKRVGKRVYHEKFGYGKVVSEEGDKLEVYFENHGRKKVLARFVSEA